MKHLRLLVISYLISHISYLSPAAMQPVELMPFTFAGRIVDYAHVAYDANTVVEVRVKGKDGALLAKTKTATRGETAYNYVIDVPMSSLSISRHAVVGETVVFEFVDPDGIIYTGLVSAGDATIGKPGEHKKVNVILARDKNGDGVPDEYVETLEYLMWLNGISEYDADADYDHDGQSNRAEYIAGTNPFDASDRFSVLKMASEKGIDGYISFKVLVNQGRTYTVSTAGKLEKDVTDWVKTEFSVADPSSALKSRLTTGPAETGYRVIYVKKEGAERYWRLNVE